MFVLYKLYFDLSKIIFHLPATFVVSFKQIFFPTVAQHEQYYL